MKKTNDTLKAEIDTINKTGLKRLSPERTGQMNILGGSVEEGLNSGTHDLRGTEYLCRQQTINLKLQLLCSLNIVQ